MYFSGQGKVFIAERDSSGTATSFRYVGNAPQFDLTFDTDVLEHKESWSGARVTDLRLLREKTASLALVLESFEPKNVALSLFGADSTITGSSVTDEALAGGSTSVVNNDYLRLAQQDVTSVVIKDSAGTPATLVLDTDYRIESAKHGSIQILDIGSYVQPFTADYTYAGADHVNMLTQGLTERWLRLEGVNTAFADKPVLVELYRVAFDPGEEFNWIGDDVLQMTLNGSALADDTKSGDALLGPFGRVVDIAA